MTKFIYVLFPEVPELRRIAFAMLFSSAEASVSSMAYKAKQVNEKLSVIDTYDY